MAMKNLQEKFIFSNFRFSVSSLILAAILAIAFFVVMAGNFQYYQTQISIIFIPKSETLSAHTPYVMENLVRFPKMLSFYERMLRDNSNLSDEFSGKTKDEKKVAWSKALDIKKDDGSSIINIKVSSKDKTQSSELAKQAARTLFGTASFYYNIKTDADFRIIDGPTTAPATRHWLWIIPLSIFLGLIVAYFSNAILSIIFKIIKDYGKKHLLAPEEKLKVARENNFSAMFPKFEPVGKRAKAPQNLPAAPLNLPIEEGLADIPPAIESIKPILENEAEPKIDEKTIIFTEPTEEELKKRLNQLLRGEL